MRLKKMNYKCPCCGHLTYDEPTTGNFEICPVCFWEDDNVQMKEPDYEGCANEVSLNQAKKTLKNMVQLLKSLLNM